VHDQGPGFDPRDENTRGSGWGVKLVEELSSDWGVERRDEGTEVWFKIENARTPATSSLAAVTDLPSRLRIRDVAALLRVSYQRTSQM
jgi:hypothetical protein